MILTFIAEDIAHLPSAKYLSTDFSAPASFVEASGSYEIQRELPRGPSILYESIEASCQLIYLQRPQTYRES